MERTKSHNFFISLYKSYKPSEEFSPYVMYTYGSGGKKMKKIPIKLPYKVWDKKKKKIKKDFVEKYFKEAEYLNEIKSNINGVVIDMTSGSLTLENAFNRLLDRSEDGFLRTWIMNSKKLTRATRKKWIAYLDSIESHLPKDYAPLTYAHIQDTNSVDFIGETLNYKSGLGNGAIDYIKMLDTLTLQAGLKNVKPFKANGHIKEKQVTDKMPVQFEDVLDGFNDMRTTQDFMAMNFWLYSLSLRGLSGVDICNISEDNIERSGRVIEDGVNYPYYPDWWVDGQWTMTLAEKMHLRVSRSKREKNRKMTILLNLLPSYLLHKSLKETLQRTHPQYAYQGKDSLRLFNFMTLTNKGEVPEGKANWKNIKDTIYTKLRRMLGAGVHTTRSTFLDTGQLRLTEQEQKELIGHKSKSDAIHHYQSPHQIKTDLNHIKAIEEFGLLELVQRFYEVGYKKGFTEYKPTLGAIKLLEKDKLTTFTIDDQIKLEVLQQNQQKRPKTKTLNDGRIVKLPREKPQELIDLENKAKEEYDPGVLNNQIEADLFDLLTADEIDARQKNYDNFSRYMDEI